MKRYIPDIMVCVFIVIYNYNIWGTCRNGNQYHKPMDSDIYILNQKCMILTIEKSKCRDV